MYGNFVRNSCGICKKFMRGLLKCLWKLWWIHSLKTSYIVIYTCSDDNCVETPIVCKKCRSKLRRWVCNFTANPNNCMFLYPSLSLPLSLPPSRSRSQSLSFSFFSLSLTIFLGPPSMKQYLSFTRPFSPFHFLLLSL